MASKHHEIAFWKRSTRELYALKLNTALRCDSLDFNFAKYTKQIVLHTNSFASKDIN